LTNKTRLFLKRLADYLKVSKRLVRNIAYHKTHQDVFVPEGYHLPKHYEKVPGLLLRGWRRWLDEEERDELRRRLERCDSLPPLNRALVIERFGLEGSSPQTFSALARRHAMTPGNVYAMVTQTTKILDGKKSLPEHLLSADDRVEWSKRVRSCRSLTKNEVLALEARFGLTGQAPQTLQNIGQTLGVSRQRIDQLVQSGRAKLDGKRRAALRVK
jgi:DNA-directed RNA polymerase sigma subunit (sigma70/sigma32)